MSDAAYDAWGPPPRRRPTPPEPEPAGVSDAMRLYGLQPPSVISTNNTSPPSEPEAPEVDVVERWHKASEPVYGTDDWDGPVLAGGDALAAILAAGDALAAALEAERAEKNDWRIAAEQAVRQRDACRERAEAEREARRTERETVDAGLRRIVNSVPLDPHPSAAPKFRTIQRIARDLLERP